MEIEVKMCCHCTANDTHQTNVTDHFLKSYLLLRKPINDKAKVIIGADRAEIL